MVLPLVPHPAPTITAVGGDTGAVPLFAWYVVSTAVFVVIVYVAVKFGRYFPVRPWP